MRTVFQCPSPKDFLQAAAEAARSSSTRLSVEAFADRLGLGRSTLKMILTGKRRITVSHVHRISKALRLTRTESDYLLNQVLRDRATAVSEKRYYGKSLTSIKTQVKALTLSLGSGELLADPYILPILVYLTEFASGTVPAAEQIAGAFGIDAERVRRALEVLDRLGMRQKAEGGVQVHYAVNRVVRAMSQQKYLKSWMAESARRIDSEYSKDTTFFNSSTIVLDRDRLPSLIEDLKSVLEKYLSEGATSEDKLMIQSSIQLFPILDPRESGV